MIVLHTFISTRLDAIIPFTPLRGWLCDPPLSRLLLFFQFSRVPWLSFVLRVALTPLALLAVRSPRNNLPLLTPHRYYYPSFVETYVTPGTYLSAGPWRRYITLLRALSSHVKTELDQLAFCLTPCFGFIFIYRQSCGTSPSFAALLGLVASVLHPFTVP